MHKYLYHGKLTAKSGKRAQLYSSLLEGSKLVTEVSGCYRYILSKDNMDENTIWVTEIWESKEDHDNSLKIKEVQEVISKAIPLLEGLPTKGQELEIIGGMGV